MLTKLFGFNPKVHSVKTEVTAGITTFLTMAYILAVNPNILSEAGMDKGALFTTTVIMGAASTIAAGIGSRYGIECILCIYSLYGNGLLVAVCPYCSISGGVAFHSPYSYKLA